MNSDRYETSRFAQWCREHQGPYTPFEEADLRGEVQVALVESIRAGDITSLDGIESPLSRRIAAHHRASAFEMNSNWACTSQSWTCPCCGRSKFQISRVGRKGQILAKLVVHHDHVGDAMEKAFHAAFAAEGTDVEQITGLKLVERMGSAFAAYEEILVCEDCNNVDAEAKKLVGAPPYFSFSPGQIRRFIDPANHLPHAIVEPQAHAAWLEAMPAYELRMKLIRAVARAAATDAHWYEPHARPPEPIPVFGIHKHGVELEIARWVYPNEALLKALGASMHVSTPNLSRWRQITQRPGKVPPGNYLAMLRSEESHGRHWDALPEDWRCPLCHRKKAELVYVGDRGKIIFALKLVTGRGPWSTLKTICNHCESTRMSLKREAAALAGKQPRDSYSFVTPEELGNIISGRPHSPHLIDEERAEKLLEVVVRRISEES